MLSFSTCLTGLQLLPISAFSHFLPDSKNISADDPSRTRRKHTSIFAVLGPVIG